MNRITKVAVGSHEWEIWVLDDNGRIWSFDGSKWVIDPDGRANDLAVDGHAIIWTVNSEGQIWYKGKNEAAWHEKSLPNQEPAKEIASGQDVTMVVDASSQSHTWRYVYGSPSDWEQVPGSATHVASGFGNTDQYCINASGTFYKYNGTKWEPYNEVHTATKGKLTSVIGLSMGRGAADKRVFCLAGGGLIYQPDGLGNYYSDDFGVASAFAVRSIDDIWTVNSSGNIYRRTRPNTGLKKLVVGSSTSRTVNGVSYDWQQVAGPDLTKAAFHWKKMQDKSKKTPYYQKTPGAG